MDLLALAGEAEGDQAPAPVGDHGLPLVQLPLGRQVAPGLGQVPLPLQGVVPEIGGAGDRGAGLGQGQHRQQGRGPGALDPVDKVQDLHLQGLAVEPAALAHLLELGHGQKFPLRGKAKHLFRRAPGQEHLHRGPGVIVPDEEVQAPVQAGLGAVPAEDHQVVVGVEGVPPGGQGQAGQGLQHGLPLGLEALLPLAAGGADGDGKAPVLPYIHPDAVDQQPVLELLVAAAGGEQAQERP